MNNLSINYFRNLFIISRKKKKSNRHTNTTPQPPLTENRTPPPRTFLDTFTYRYTIFTWTKLHRHSVLCCIVCRLYDIKCWRKRNISKKKKQKEISNFYTVPYKMKFSVFSSILHALLSYPTQYSVPFIFFIICIHITLYCGSRGAVGAALQCFHYSICLISYCYSLHSSTNREALKSFSFEGSAFKYI